MKCQICGREELLPFQCPYCSKQFCTYHRLPENHKCNEMDLVYKSKKEGNMILGKTNSFKYDFNYNKFYRPKSKIYFSYKEIKHLIIASLLVIGVGLSIGFYAFTFTRQGILHMAILAFILTTSFFIHEIAHKIIAQKTGLWAEFRLTLWGSLLTIVFMILPVIFKIISPGAVMISGSAKRHEIGKISIVGPLTNIILACSFIGLMFLSPTYNWIFIIGALFNSYIALFNLIPFGILDGFKVFNWNKIIWLATFCASLALTIISYSFA